MPDYKLLRLEEFPDGERWVEWTRGDGAVLLNFAQDAERKGLKVRINDPYGHQVYPVLRREQGREEGLDRGRKAK